MRPAPKRLRRAPSAGPTPAAPRHPAVAWTGGRVAASGGNASAVDAACRARARPGAAASAAAAGLACLLLGCSPSPAVGYFPLEAGHRWTYDVKTEWENNVVEHEPLVLSSHGSETIDGGAAFRRRSDSGVEYWLRSDDTGVYRVASKSDLDAEPKPDAAPRYVLKAPLAVGSQWQATTTAYLLQRRADFPRELRHSHPSIPMNYTIEAVGEALDTRAGRFADCLRVKGTAVVRVYADPVIGWRDIPLSTTEWYCNGVGLVRLVREEPANATFLTGGTLTMELVAWQP